MNRDENTLVQRIARVFRKKPSGNRTRVRLGLADDAALFAPSGGCETILTCDWFLEGAHFLRDKHPADSVGWKCLARAVSDVAAMGGVPRCFLVSLALPETHTGQWLDGFLDGLKRAAVQFDCVLAGGDTTLSKKILVNVTVVGEVRKGQAVLRSGAKPGDVIFVSGRLGEAELGLQLSRAGKTLARKMDRTLQKHLYPEPRIALGRWLAEKSLATAMMDISDGLSSDLPRLCSSSSVGARIESAMIPQVQSSALGSKHRWDPLQLALHGGDDYELLFTVAPRNTRVIRTSFRGMNLTPIGKITETQKLLFVEENGRERRLVPGGWDPFRIGRSRPR